MKALPIALVALAVVFLVAGVLYAMGVLPFLATTGTHHYKHLIASIVLAAACLVGANFARQRAAA